MKQFTIEVKHASGPQLQTIAAELKIMSHGWAKFGPRITINKRATSLTACPRDDRISYYERI